MRNPIIWINNKLEIFFGRISSNTSISIEHISFYRIAIGLFFLIMPPDYLWLTEVPAGFFRPHVLTFARLFDSLPPSIFFEISHVLIKLLLVAVVLGIKTRISFLLLFIITITNNSFAYSLGKIDHGIFAYLIFLLMAFSNGGVKYALIPDNKIKFQDLAFSVFAICLIFAFFTAGFEKSLVWIDFDLNTSGVFRWFYSNYFNIERTELLADYFFYTPLWLSEMMDYTAVIFELSGILFLYYSRKSWYLYLILAAFFHLINTLVLNIAFIPHFIVYGLWLLSPILIKYKWLLCFLLIPIWVDHLYSAVILWSLLLVISMVCWFNIWEFKKVRSTN